MALKFEGDPPYELLLLRPAKAKAEDGSVVLTLPVSLPGPEQPEHEIRLWLRFGHAHGLRENLRTAAIEAQKQARETE
jgi:hypothetical protein